MSEDDVAATLRDPLLDRDINSAGNEDNCAHSSKHLPNVDGNGTDADEATTAELTTTPVNNSNIAPSSEDNPPAAAPSAALLGCCTLAIVLIGLGLVVFVSFLPLWIFLALRHALPITYWIGLLMAMLINLLHLRALWISAGYLRVLRTLVLPIRRLLLPLVFQTARIESIREQESTQYYEVNPSSEVPEFRKSVRRHYRRMQKIYQRHGIRHECVRAESSLVLRDVIPVVWQHQQRSMDSASPIEEFVKRALVVTLVPDGILDLYYSPDNQLVCVQFSILQGNYVWHWFMYFCANEASRAGIWWHGALLAIQRGHALPNVRFVNAHMHQKDSKLHAGYSAADHTQRNVLDRVYPWEFTRHIPDAALDVRLWDSALPSS